MKYGGLDIKKMELSNARLALSVRNSVAVCKFSKAWNFKEIRCVVIINKKTALEKIIAMYILCKMHFICIILVFKREKVYA